MIVKMDIVFHVFDQFISGQIFIQVISFCLKSAPKAFNRLVIKTLRYSGHTCSKFECISQRFVSMRSILETTVAMNQWSCSWVRFEGLRQRLNDNLIIISRA